MQAVLELMAAAGALLKEEPYGHKVGVWAGGVGGEQSGVRPQGRESVGCLQGRDCPGRGRGRVGRQGRLQVFRVPYI